MTNCGAVDVVIPTRDRPAALATCLSALACQRFDGLTVIVVDDGGSAPATQSVSCDLRAILRMRFVRNDTPLGPGPSRNRGVETGQAPHLIFLDDDCVATPGLIARHRAALARGGRVVSLGPILSRPGRRLPVWTHWDADRLERRYAQLTSGAGSPDWTHLYTGNVGLRRQDFLAVGGFDERFARQEDIELGYRLAQMGCRFAFDPDAVVWHDSERSLRSWLRIPAASASFDVLMDRLDPGSHRLATVHRNLKSRHWALRTARKIANGPALRAAVTAAVGAGRFLHAVRADRPALSACSMAWDLTYTDALRRATNEISP